MDVDTIRLTDVTGIARKSGMDDRGNRWTEFEVDFFAGETTGECAICGAEIEEGFLCLDGADEVCRKHVEIVDEM